MKKRALILSAAVIIFALAGAQALAQQEATQAQPESFSEQWLLGDVVALNLETSQLTVSYIDYQTYEEKEIIIKVDSETNYINISSLKDIRVGDAVSVDYIIGSRMVAIALNIRVE